MGGQFLQILALEEEMVVFTQCHEQVLYGFSLASVEFYGVEVRFADLEASPHEIHDLIGSKIEEL